MDARPSRRRNRPGRLVVDVSRCPTRRVGATCRQLKSDRRRICGGLCAGASGRREARSSFFPTIGAEGGATRSREPNGIRSLGTTGPASGTGVTTTGSGGTSIRTTYVAELEASWVPICGVRCDARSRVTRRWRRRAPPTSPMRAWRPRLALGGLFRAARARRTVAVIP